MSLFICKLLFCSNGQSERLIDENTDEIFDEDCLPEGNTAQSSHEDLPFTLDEESSGGSPSYPETPTKNSTYGFSPVPPRKAEITGSRIGSRQLAEGNLKASFKTMDLDLVLDNRPKKGSYVDNLE